MSSRPDQPDDNGAPDHNDGSIPGAPGSAAERVIEKFGGIRPMAHKLGVPVTTVQGWKKRGAIPTSRHAELMSAATRHGIALEPGELEAAAPADEQGAESAAEAAEAETAADTSTQEAETRDAMAPVPEPEPAVAGATEPRPADPPRARSGVGLATTALLVSLLAAGAAATAPWWAPDLLTPVLGPPRGSQALEERVATLSDTVEQLEARSARDTGEIGQRVSDLEQALNQIQSQAEAGAGGATTDELTALTERTATLEQQISELQATEQGTNGVQVSAAIQGRVQSLAQRVDQLAGQVEQLSATQSRLDQLSQSVATLESEANRLAQDLSNTNGRLAEVAEAASQLRTEQDVTQALVLAAGQLRSALATSGPFEAELAAVRALSPQDPELREALELIEPHAATGIPTEARLAERFDRLVGDVVRAGSVEDQGSWTDQALSRITSLVSVRRPAGNAEGNSASAIVARAEARLDEGDLAAALDELAALDGEAEEVVQPWFDAALARIAADTAVTRLTGQAIARLAGDAGTAPQTASGSTSQPAQQGGTVSQ